VEQPEWSDPLVSLDLPDLKAILVELDQQDFKDLKELKESLVLLEQLDLLVWSV